MGIRHTKLPWVVLGGGITGAGLGILMQWWMNAHDYRLIVSGKPFFSLPANIPIMFELTILLSAISAFVGMIAFNNLPMFHHPVFKSERFRRATTDRFVVVIEAADPKFDPEHTARLPRRARRLLGRTGGGVREMNGIPRWIFLVTLVLVAFSWIPFAFIARARNTKHGYTRIQIIPDMDQQPKFKAQSQNTLFADTRAARPLVSETVAQAIGVAWTTAPGRDAERAVGDRDSDAGHRRADAAGAGAVRASTARRATAWRERATGSSRTAPTRFRRGRGRLPPRCTTRSCAPGPTDRSSTRSRTGSVTCRPTAPRSTKRTDGRSSPTFARCSGAKTPAIDDVPPDMRPLLR